MKKGFTLIELLAVIVILAIIALIVTPTISKVINGAKKNAAEQSARGYVKAIDTTNQASIINESATQLSSNTTRYGVDISTLDVSASGKVPTSGYVDIKNNSVVHASLCSDNYRLDFINNEVTLTEVPGCKKEVYYISYDMKPAGVSHTRELLDEPDPSWVNYLETTYYGGKMTFGILHSRLNGKEVTIDFRNINSLNDLIKDSDNGILTANLCGPQSASYLSNIESKYPGTTASGIKCNKVFSDYYSGISYVETVKNSDNPDKFTAKEIKVYTLAEYNKSDNKIISYCELVTDYYSEADIRSDMLEYINMSENDVKALPKATLKNILKYFKGYTDSQLNSISDANWSAYINYVATFLNDYKVGMKVGYTHTFGCNYTK